MCIYVNKWSQQNVGITAKRQHLSLSLIHFWNIYLLKYQYVPRGEGGNKRGDLLPLIITTKSTMGLVIQICNWGFKKVLCS